MPESATITIQGYDFPFADKYEEGHTLTGNEANVLNQTFNENLRNNFAGKVKAAKEAHNGGEIPDDKLNELRSEFETYSREYEFGTRRTSTGGGGDPVKKLAMSLARTAIKDAIRAKGEKKVADYTDEQIDSAAEKYLEGRGSALLEQARQRLAEKKASAQDALEALGG